MSFPRIARRKLWQLPNYGNYPFPTPPFLSHFVSFCLKPNAHYFMSKGNKLNHKLFKLCRQTETDPPRQWSWSLSGWLSALQVELGASVGPLLGNVSKRS